MAEKPSLVAGSVLSSFAMAPTQHDWSNEKSAWPFLICSTCASGGTPMVMSKPSTLLVSGSSGTPAARFSSHTGLRSIFSDLPCVCSVVMYGPVIGGGRLVFWCGESAGTMQAKPSASALRKPPFFSVRVKVTVLPSTAMPSMSLTVPFLYSGTPLMAS